MGQNSKEPSKRGTTRPNPNEPSKRVQRTIAKLYTNKNRYATLDDDDSTSGDSDTGGGVPLYSPEEEEFKKTEKTGGGAPPHSPVESVYERGGGAPLHSPVESVYERGGGAPLYSPGREKNRGGALLSSRDDDESSEESSEESSDDDSDDESDTIFSTRGTGANEDIESRNGTEESVVQADNKPKPSYDVNLAKLEPQAGRVSHPDTQASGPSRVGSYGSPGPSSSASQVSAGPSTSGSRGPAGPSTSGSYGSAGPASGPSFNSGVNMAGAGRQADYRVPHYNPGYDRVARAARNGMESPPHSGTSDPTNTQNDPEGYGGPNMYPQYTTNRGYTHYGTPHRTYPAHPYQQGAGLGYGYPRVDGSPAPTTVINTEMTPKPAPTPPGLAYGTPTRSGPVVQSEPRNFAPLPQNASIYQGPPPQFMVPNIAGPVHGAGAQSNGSEDPFTAFPPGEHNSRAPLPIVMEADENSSSSGTLVPVHPVHIAPEIRAIRSGHLNKLTEGPIGLPTTEEAFNPANFPFIESCSQYEPQPTGIVHLANIPFSTKQNEILALFGRNAKIVKDVHEPVHIMMERTTSKTQDAYVEFLTVEDAMKAVERLDHAAKRGRLARLGDRPVTVTLSSISKLMKDLFPLARGVIWHGSNPSIQEPVEGQPWKNFKGFFTEEEMTILVKHVEIPARSPYNKECPQRPFECLISVIKKAPWHMAEHITIRQRYAVYNATYRLLELLTDKMKRHREQILGPGQVFQEHSTLNNQLKKRLVRAAMLCPGFSVVQKDNIAYMVDMPEHEERGFNQPPNAEMWTHQLAVCPRPGIPVDVLEWYIAVIREETMRHVQRKDITERTKVEAMATKIKCHYFGYLWHEIGFPSGPAYDEMTLRQAANLELSAIERVLKRALPAIKA